MTLVQHNLLLLLLFMLFSAGECSTADFFRRLFYRKSEENEEDGATSKYGNIEIIISQDRSKLVEKRSAADTEQQCDLPPCSDDQLMVYLAELQAINPESIINLSTFDELFILCKQVSDSLDKMDAFLKTCRISQEKNLYIQLIKGVNKLYESICEDKGKLRKDFGDHFACLRDLHDDFETCYGPPDWTEFGNRRDICKAYKDICDCYYIKTAKVCGKKAAAVMKRVVKTVIDAIITVHCSVGINPSVDDAMPERSRATIKGEIRKQVLLVLMMVIINL